MKEENELAKFSTSLDRLTEEVSQSKRSFLLLITEKFDRRKKDENFIPCILLRFGK